MAAPSRILVVDDDPDIRDLIAQFLRPQGYDVTTAGDGKVMREALAHAAADLVILDIMLPDEDGLSLCRWLRSNPGTARIAIIMLTAMSSETDRVVGLEMGADDYLPKPFSTRELLARVKAVMRRSSATSVQMAPARKGLIRFAGWTLDVNRRQLKSPDDVLVELTGGEFDLLLVFLRNPQKVISRDQLLDLTRGRISSPFDRTIDVQVGRLRRKIEVDPKKPELIKTVRSGGYVCAAMIEEE